MISFDVAKPARERGFALLIVLWSLVLLGLVFTQLLASARTAMALAGNQRAAAQARALADGAVYEALFHLLATGRGQWAPDGRLHRLGGGAVITVQASSLAGEINPNLASTDLLAGLLQAVGNPPAQAQTLAAAVIEWRSLADSQQEATSRLARYRRAGLSYGPPGRPFLDLSDLGNVIGMTPLLLVQILPHLSLYQTTDPDPAFADPIVRRALMLSGQAGSGSGAYDGGVPVVSIEVIVRGPGKAVAKRRAIASLGSAGGLAPFEILSLTDTQ